MECWHHSDRDGGTESSIIEYASHAMFAAYPNESCPKLADGFKLEQRICRLC